MKPLQPLRLDAPLGDLSPFPLDMTLVKQHVGADGSDFDALLDLYARAAIEWAEGEMHRSIYQRPHVWVLREFPYGRGEIRLPRGKTQSVDSVAYVVNGQTTTLTGPSSTPAGSGYQEDLRGDDGGVIMPVRGGSWPSVDLEVPAPVVITFTAGYPADEVPADMLRALLFAVADAFDVRGTADLRTAGGNLGAREALVSSYRLTRWY